MLSGKITVDATALVFFTIWYGMTIAFLALPTNLLSAVFLGVILRGRGPWWSWRGNYDESMFVIASGVLLIFSALFGAVAMWSYTRWEMLAAWVPTLFVVFGANLVLHRYATLHGDSLWRHRPWLFLLKQGAILGYFVGMFQVAKEGRPLILILLAFYILVLFGYVLANRGRPAASESPRRQTGAGEEV